MINIDPKYLRILLRSLPNFLWPLKKFIVIRSLKKRGKNIGGCYNLDAYDHRLIEIGENVFIGENANFATNVGIKIGDYVMFGPNVMILGGDHNFRIIGKPMFKVKSGGINKQVIIEDDVWIGARSIILKGVKISEGTVLAAGSIITETSIPYSVYGGVPARFIKWRFSFEDLEEHLKIIGSKYTLNEVKKIYNNLIN